MHRVSQSEQKRKESLKELARHVLRLDEKQEEEEAKKWSMANYILRQTCVQRMAPDPKWKLTLTKVRGRLLKKRTKEQTQPYQNYRREKQTNDNGCSVWRQTNRFGGPRRNTAARNPACFDNKLPLVQQQKQATTPIQHRHQQQQQQHIRGNMGGSGIGGVSSAGHAVNANANANANTVVNGPFVMVCFFYVFFFPFFSFLCLNLSCVVYCVAWCRGRFCMSTVWFHFE